MIQLQLLRIQGGPITPLLYDTMSNLEVLSSIWSKSYSRRNSKSSSAWVKPCLKNACINWNTLKVISHVSIFNDANFIIMIKIIWMAAIHFKWFVKGHSALVHDNGHFQNQYKTIWISTLDMLKSKFKTKSTI